MVKKKNLWAKTFNCKYSLGVVLLFRSLETFEKEIIDLCACDTMMYIV